MFKIIDCSYPGQQLRKNKSYKRGFLYLMKQLTKENVKLQFDENTLQFSIQAGASRWNTCPSFYPKIITADGELLFSSALRIKHMPWKSGLGKGILSHYDGFSWEEKHILFPLKPFVGSRMLPGMYILSWYLWREESLLVKEILWPGPFEFTKASASWYTLINLQRGSWFQTTGRTAW